MAHSDPERVLLAQIEGAARHLAWSRPGTPEEHAAAAGELHRIASGRADLLAELAGTSIGYGESQLDSAWYRYMADLCIEAGADEERIPEWIPVGRSRAEYARISPSTTGRPGRS